jgi:hypothetical protein
MFCKPEHRLARIAAQIHDPLVRLRFLRTSSGALDERPRIRPSVVLLLPAVLAGFLLPARHGRPPEAPQRPPKVIEEKPAPAMTRVWMVETSLEHELYSNGLRVDTTHAVRNHERSYFLYAGDEQVAATEPAGIVYHSTESDTLPLEPEQNLKLRRRAESVVSYVQRRRAYHYLVDRFGRVYRIVSDSDSADHAGNSVWSWNGSICLSLNHAFFGVAFEAQTDDPLNLAQIHAGRILTEMLRSRFGIVPENCVTHAQVSVNPSNMRVGWHTDWARNFPFAELGLPNNYERPLASVAELGFVFDTGYLGAAGEGLWVGLHRSEAQLKATAAEHRVSVAEWRHRLARRYHELARRG